MKKIDVSFASDVSEQPFLARSVDHMQQGYSEALNSLLLGAMGSYTTGDIIILQGCVFTGADPGARTISAGSIYYNGEIYQVPSASFTTTGSQIPLWTKVTSYQAGDPLLFTDGATHNVHYINTFVVVAGLPGGSGTTGYIADYNATTVKNIIGRTYNLTSINNWATPPGLIVDFKGFVRFKGTQIANFVIPTAAIMFVLPSGFIPVVEKNFIVQASLNGSTYGSFLLRIDTSGNCYFLNTDRTTPTFTANSVIFMDAVLYNIY